MKEFIYQITKKEEEEGLKLNIFSTNDKCETKQKKIELSYQVLCKKKDFDSLKIKSEKVIIHKDKLHNKNKEEVIRVEINSKELHNYLLSELKDHEFETYEADLPEEHRYLIDNDIELSKNEEYLPLKYISFDIETIGEDIKNQKISMISTQSFFDKKVNKVFLNSEKVDIKKIKELEKTKFTEFTLEILAGEKELLEAFKKEILNFKPQAIVGWNCIDFDFKMIRDRMVVHGIEFKFSEFEGDTTLRINKGFFRDSTIQISGILVFDIIQVLRMNFISFEDYKLDTVAQSVLKDSKIEISDPELDNNMENKLESINNMFEKNLKKLIEYNFKDSLLVSQIIEKLNLLELMCKRSIITGTPLFRIKSPIATLDIMYLKELHKKNLVADSNFNYNATAPIEGAFVAEPKKGFYEDIFVYDFKSLYPSIIMTFNIDPFTYSKNGQIEAPNGAKFDNDKGILPSLILKLYNERDIAKKEKDDIKSYALKTTMNSFYGAMASPKSRYYNKDLGGAITSFGRFIIKKAGTFMKERGDLFVYTDTDSIFIKHSKLSKPIERKKFGKEVEKQINEYFDKWVSTDFKQKSFLTIELEKIYHKFFIASKKRYVGLNEFTNKLQFVGMEAIRGDWTQLAQNFQIELVKIMFEGKNQDEIKKFILEYVESLRKGEFDDLLVYKKKITKPLIEYTKTTPPHVRAARELKSFEGRLVRYVMTKDGPKHVSLLENPVYDYDHYTEKQLRGVSDDLLESIGLDFDKIVSKGSQKSLNKFF